MEIIIVGGSIAGLLHGVMLKKLGHQVTILEQSLVNDRPDQGAGMGTGPNGRLFFERHDHDPAPYSFFGSGLMFWNQEPTMIASIKLPVNQTSWPVMYHRLRAMFDAYTSPFSSVPSPPSGSARFELGKRVVGAQSCDHGNSVEVQVRDLRSGTDELEVRKAQLVIDASGSTSSLRRQFFPAVEQRHTGMVCWRGLVPETKVSNATLSVFENYGLHRLALPSGYIGAYMVPGPNGSVAEGTRFINYVWYAPLDERSADYKAAMTDREGHAHRNLLPRGKMAPDVWSSQKAYAAKHMPAMFSEVVLNTEYPFLASVRESFTPQLSLLNGKLLFVGEAAHVIRPNGGAAMDLAAYQCLLLEKVLAGTATVDQWEAQSKAERTRVWLMSKVNGDRQVFGERIWYWSRARLSVFTLWQKMKAMIWKPILVGFAEQVAKAKTQ